MIHHTLYNKLDLVEIEEYERLSQNYWNSTDDIEFADEFNKTAEDLLTQELQLKNLLDYEEQLRRKYLPTTF